MTVELLVERVSCGPVGRIDVEAGILHGVRVLGHNSLNRRKYPPETLAKARGLYEGRRVNADHPEAARADAVRSIDDTVGWLEGVQIDSGGLRADLHLLKTDPRAPKILEAAERNPSLFGLSHNVEGKVRHEGDQTIVEEILRVRSVDIVSDPATARSLFESQNQGTERRKEAMLSYPATPEGFARAIRGGSFTSTLREEDPAGASAPSLGAPATGREQIERAILDLVRDASLDVATKVSKFRDLMKALERGRVALDDADAATQDALRGFSPARESISEAAGRRLRGRPNEKRVQEFARAIRR